jgi:hypothetical protein
VRHRYVSAQAEWSGASRQEPFAWAEAGQTYAIKELEFSRLMPKDIAVRFVCLCWPFDFFPDVGYL